MRKFYQLYKLKEVKTQLSWSHYRELLLVDDFSIRLKLESLAIREDLSQLELQKRVKQALSDKSRKSNSESKNESMPERVKRPLMWLYLYRTLQKFSSDLERQG